MTRSCHFARYIDWDNIRRATMADYILLMHGDSKDQISTEEWAPYIENLSSKNLFRGGSEIGTGACMKRGSPVPGITDHLVGYIRIEVRDLDDARTLMAGNPVYEAGGTLEIRELPRSD